MHHTRQPTTSGNLRHQPEHLIPIRHITRHHPHRRTQRRQPLRQPTRTRSLRTTPRHQHQRPHPIHRHQMLRHQRTQRTRTTGHQHRTITQARRLHRRDAGPDQARRVHRTPSDGQLAAGRGRFPQDAVQQGHQRGVQVAVDVREDHAARVLRLRRTQQTPHRRARQVGHPVAVADRHRAPGHDHEPRVRQGVRREPGLHRRQHVRGHCPDRLRRRRAGRGEHRHQQRPGS